MEQEGTFYATGRRKTAIARTWLKPGKGEIIINSRPIDEYFSANAAKQVAIQPFELTNTVGEFDIMVNVRGGGILGIFPGRDWRFAVSDPSSCWQVGRENLVQTICRWSYGELCL